MMIDRDFVFYVGTNNGNWLWAKENKHPLFVSVRRLKNHKKLPKAKTDWACDSGGFTELSMYGKWVTTPTEYIQHLERFEYEIGSLNWAAAQDYMCEPQILKKTNKTVEEHQHLTCQNYLILTRLNPSLPIVPVLQGWLPDDYFRHAEMYATYGVILREKRTVGVGSVCRRTKVDGMKQVFRELSQDHLKLHGFGLKQDGIKSFGSSLFSSDSMAWSFAARAAGWRNEYLCGQKHENAKSCTDCHDWAMKWADRVVAFNDD